MRSEEKILPSSIFEDIQLKRVCEEVDSLDIQLSVGSELPPIYGAGQIRNPKIAFVFINPTHRNISSSKEWKGLRAPWIGVKNIWRLFGQAGAIGNESLTLTQQSKWTEEFAINHYRNLADRGYYITNLVKWTGPNAKFPTATAVKAYREILKDELATINPRFTIAFGQLTFATLVPQHRSTRFSDLISEEGFETYDSEDFKNVIPNYFPVGQGIKNWDKSVKVVKMVVDKVSKGQK